MAKTFLLVIALTCQLCSAFQTSAAFRPSALSTRHVAKPSVSMMAKSKAIPSMDCPAALDGTLAGDKGFDPLLLSDWAPIGWMREAELKHGRIAQLAALGFIAVDCGFKLPGKEELTSVTAHDASLDALKYMFIAITLIETAQFAPTMSLMEPGATREAGDCGIPFNNLSKKRGKDWYREVEISHCRLAMLAFSGMVTQSVLADKGFPYF